MLPPLEQIHYGSQEQLLVLDSDLRVIHASPAFYKAFKVEPADTIQRKLGELGNGQWNIVDLLDLLSGLAATGANFHAYEVQRTFTDLGLRTMLLRARPLEVNGQSTGLIVLAIEDITGSKKCDAELIQQLAQFEAALSSIAAGVIVTDAYGMVTYMNPVAESLTGWNLKEAAQRPLGEIYNIVNERLRKPLESPVVRAIRDGPILGLAGLSILIARNGTQRPMEDSATPIRDSTGKAIGGVVIFSRITHRRQVAKRLERSEIRYRRLFETAHDGILILDAKSDKILDVNRFMLDLLQHPIEHFLGKELWEIGVLHNAEANKAAIAILKDQGHIRYDDLPLEDINGRRIPVEFVSNLYREGDQEVIQCNVRDITERRRAEIELQKAKADAEAANRAKSEFLANMSHEIRTPMTAILGFADMVLEPNQTEEGRTECVRTIHRNGTYLLEIINGILDLSKIEEGKMTIEEIPCELRALLIDIVALIRPKADEKGLLFELVVQCPIPSVIRTDPLRLQQILVNLLGNAIKFTSKGKITLNLYGGGTEPHNQLIIEIIDSGIGMTPEQLQRLFRPFNQADESITRKFGGTGLGLTISRQLAHLLGGEIEVKSELGVGSTFKLTIAAGSFAGSTMLSELTEKMLLPNPIDNRWQDIPLHGRILLAEDGKDNQRLLSTHLRSCGAEVVIAENGQIALDLVSQGPFDLILMDMQMPVMDGYTAASELRRRGCTTPIVALTAHAMAEDRKKCIDHGCTDYLSKPIERQLLLRTAGKYLNTAAVSASPALSNVSTNPQGSSPPAAVTTDADAGATIKSSLIGKPGMTELITDFVNGLPGEVQKMTDMLRSNDLESLRRLVHQMRGAAGGYGFDTVTATASKAEGAINAATSLDTINAEVKSLISSMRRIEGYDAKADKVSS
jgi:PAS domain S-box-containing protein